MCNQVLISVSHVVQTIMSYDPQKKQNLKENQQQDRQKEAEEKEQARKKLAANPRKNLSAAKKIIKSSSLFSQKKSTDAVFFIALMAAGLKDLLDIAQATGVGYALVVIMTILIFIFIGFMILIGISLGGGGGINILLMLFGGTTVEILPGISFLPATMGIVATIYVLILKKRKQNAEKIKQQNYA